MLYPIDSEGLVINEANEARVQAIYKPLINEVLEFSHTIFGTNLRSLYVRGSVSVGRGAPNISDVDSVLILHKEVSSEDRKKISVIAEDLRKKYPFVTFVDITTLTLDQVLASPEYLNLKIYLKTQSYLVYGDDILSFLPSVRPGPELALAMYGGLEKECASLHSVMSGEDTSRTYLGERKSTEFWCVWQMRVLLRSGLGLVMMSKPVYSQDLLTCFEVFSEAYPSHSDQMKRALDYALRPTPDSKELLAFIDGFVPGFIELWKSSIIKYEQKN